MNSRKYVGSSSYCKYTLKTNCKIIDACLHLHNFIVDHREGLVMINIDKSVFDDECRRVFAVQPDIEGVMGGESDICRIHCSIVFIASTQITLTS